VLQEKPWPPPGRTTIHHIRGGELWASETAEGVWAVSWYPHRRDHPDYPGTTIDSAHEPSMPVDQGADAILRWARERFATEDASIVGEVAIEEEAAVEEVDAIERLFDEAGVRTVVSASVGRKSADLLPWALMLKIPLTAFVTGLAAKASEDAWIALKRLVRAIYEARRRPDRADGSIWLDDGERVVILTDRVSDEGFRQVAAGELPPGGHYVWDRERGGWRGYPPGDRAQ
jgi:hypothetical protein